MSDCVSLQRRGGGRGEGVNRGGREEGGGKRMRGERGPGSKKREWREGLGFRVQGSGFRV